MAVKTGIKPLDDYCSGVKSGKINVCKWVRLAVDRHFRDLKRQNTKDFPYYFEPKAAEHYVNFLSENLCHYEGIVAGEPLEFEPWQWLAFGSIFGWLKTDRFKDMPIRRFRSADVIIPKKNGKSIISGATGLYMMDPDGWPGAQCYILAKNQTHAKDLGYRAAQIMVENSPELLKRYKIRYDAAQAGIYCKQNRSFYKAITSKAESEDGRNVHFCGPDETKDWTNFDVYNLMKNGTVNAPNSLILSTTTAGPNQESLGFKRQQYLQKVLEQSIDDESLFGVIYTIDPEDKEKPNYWLDPEVWEKCNPNYNVSVYGDALKTIATEAKESLSQRIDFETKHLNIWHSSISSFIAAEKWKECNKREIEPPFKDFDSLIAKYAGQKSYIGLDMGSVDDFTAVPIVVWNQDNSEWDAIPLFVIPEDNINDRKNAHLVRPWIENGYILTTPGQTTNHDFTEDLIRKVAEKTDLIELAMDRHKTELIAPSLEGDGIECLPIGQGYVGMAPCVDTLESMVLEKKINHGGNPVLQWMMSNVVIQKDPAGNRKFAKDKAQDKIDGAVALAMALYRSVVSEGESASTWDEVTFI